MDTKYTDSVIDEEKLLTGKEIEETLNISRSTLTRLVNEGLPYHKVGVSKKLYSPSVVTQFLIDRQLKIQSLKPGMVLTNKEVCSHFKCSPQGGMRRSHTTNALVLICDQTGSSIYEDKWTDNGQILIYTGMGQEADQVLEGTQNNTLFNSGTNGVSIYLFEVFKRGEYTYRGAVRLVDEPYQIEEKDLFGTERLVWKFKLAPISGSVIVPQEIIEKNEVEKLKQIKNVTLEELEEKANEFSGESSQRKVVSVHYSRNAYVSQYTKERAKGVCQLCEEKPKFNGLDGKPYLESHHVTHLSRGGRDSIDNCVALCPSCHKKVHILELPEDIEKLQKVLDSYKDNE